MSRPTTYGGDRRNVSVRLNGDIYQRLVTAAEEREVSITWMMNRAIAQYLDRLIPIADLSKEMR